MKTLLIVAALATAGFVGMKTVDCGGPCFLSGVIASIIGCEDDAACDTGFAPVGTSGGTSVGATGARLAAMTTDIPLDDIPFDSTGVNDCGGLIVEPCCSGSLSRADMLVASTSVHGDYVEARSAAVFAGACHVNGEYDLTGRQALLAFSIDGGSHDGVDLTGVEVVVSVSSNANLAECGDRTSVAYLSPDLDEAVADATVAWLRATHGEALGRLHVAPAAIEVSLDGDTFAVSIDGTATLTGTALEDRACCAMPENIWYEPLIATTGAVVGKSDTCRFEGDGALDAWTYQNQNNAFVARF